MIILRDERYSQEACTFESYDEMINELRALCELNHWEFTEPDIKDIQYEEL
uniref:Uncharacterized protein n=1 Tax=viral metagenome TaxID=1070528 RepID=A0A6M3L9R3_9ZZZZ